jgi:hypothetical protein
MKMNGARGENPDRRAAAAPAAASFMERTTLDNLLRSTREPRRRAQTVPTPLRCATRAAIQSAAAANTTVTPTDTWAPGSAASGFAAAR